METNYPSARNQEYLSIGDKVKRYKPWRDVTLTDVYYGVIKEFIPHPKNSRITIAKVEIYKTVSGGGGHFVSPKYMKVQTHKLYKVTDENN